MVESNGMMVRAEAVRIGVAAVGGPIMHAGVTTVLAVACCGLCSTQIFVKLGLIIGTSTAVSVRGPATSSLTRALHDCIDFSCRLIGENGCQRWPTRLSRCHCFCSRSATTRPPRRSRRRRPTSGPACSWPAGPQPESACCGFSARPGW